MLNSYPCVSKHTMVGRKINYSSFHQPKPLHFNIHSQCLGQCPLHLDIRQTPSRSPPAAIPVSSLYCTVHHYCYILPNRFHPYWHLSRLPPSSGCSILARHSPRLPPTPLLPSSLSYSDYRASHSRYSRFVSITSRRGENPLS
jgi:hypothetical protein